MPHLMIKNFSLLFIVVFLCVLCGCSNTHKNDDIDSYEDSYEQGYENGYNDGYEENHIENNYNEEAHDFQKFITNLMYDGKYDTVRDLQEEYPEKVENALENEFGTTDIDTIIDYLENGSQTVIGTCEICNEPVYADEMAILPDGIECAHSYCISGNDNGEPPRINKDE